MYPYLQGEAPSDVRCFKTPMHTYIHIYIYTYNHIYIYTYIYMNASSLYPP